MADDLGCARPTGKVLGEQAEKNAPEKKRI